MASTDTFINKLLGYHDLMVNGGSLLPRRHQMNIIRGRVEDVDGETQITISDSPQWLAAAEVLSADANDFSPTGFAGLSDVGVDPTGATRTITGFDATSLTVYTKRIWNFTTDSRDLVVAHDDSGSVANNRVTTPGELDLTIPTGSAIVLIRNAADSAWRALPCWI